MRYVIYSRISGLHGIVGHLQALRFAKQQEVPLRAIAPLIAAAAALLADASTQACTRVLWNTSKLGVYISRTMDWPGSTESRLVVFPRGIARDGGRLGGEMLVKEEPGRAGPAATAASSPASTTSVPPMALTRRGSPGTCCICRQRLRGARCGQAGGECRAVAAVRARQRRDRERGARAAEGRTGVTAAARTATRRPCTWRVEDASGDSAIIEHLRKGTGCTTAASSA